MNKGAEKRQCGKETMLSPLQSQQGWAHLQSEPGELPCSQTPLVGPLGTAGSSDWVLSLLCSISSCMPISVFVSDWPRWALSLVLLCGACYVIVGLSVQPWPVERGRWERESPWEGLNAWKGLRVDFCSEPVHWMVASNAACLPMAQLFANLSPLLTLLYRLAFSAPSCPPRATLIPSASLAKKKNKKNKSDLIWLSPSYCQGLPEQCETRQSGTWLKVTECSVVFALQLV